MPILVKAVQDMLQAMTVVIQGRHTSLTLLQVDSLAFSVYRYHNGILLDVLFFRQAKADAAMQIWAACRLAGELVSEYVLCKLNVTHWQHTLFPPARGSVRVKLHSTVANFVVCDLLEQSAV